MIACCCVILHDKNVMKCTVIVDAGVVPFCRAAEILYSLVMGYSEYQNDFAKLVVLRRNSALLQHHDAITGTAQHSVVVSSLEM